MSSGLGSTVQLAHRWLECYIKPGGRVVDATVGNGKDTVYLAGKVGVNGKVYGFDIQEKALRNTYELLKSQGYDDIVQLFHTGHENLAAYVGEELDAIIFNLGYLPNGDHSIVTRPDTTIKAVADGLALLRQGGAVCLVVYTGHSGGEEEQAALEHFLAELDKRKFSVAKLSFLNRVKAPYIIMVEKSLD